MARIRDPKDNKKQIDETIVWDAESGERLAYAPRPELAADAPAPAGLVAAIEDDRILLAATEVPAAEVARRRWALAPKPDWHWTQADDAAAKELWFTAAFHYRRLLELPPPANLMRGSEHEAFYALDGLRVAAGKLGRTEESLDCYRKAVVEAGRFAAWAETQGKDRGTERYNAACYFARCTSAGQKDAPALWEKSVALLRLAKADGFFTPENLAHFREDVDFAGVRDRPEYWAFMAELVEVAPMPRRIR